jgi:3-oxoacyl-[acyl-carrier-protein] synthase-1/3-oxoacyl-[acyl-carrier-protein] synthase II
VHPLKAQLGHTLGAAGGLEALACVDALERGVLPAAAGEGALDPLSDVKLLARGAAGAPRAALKLASAFGGANAALVLTSERGRPRATRAAFVGRAVRLEREPSLEDLAALTGARLDRLARLDGLARLAVAAVGQLGARAGSLAGSGLVMGSALATLETNALFAARIRARGARLAEPRRFPYTSPNAAAGECAILFGLTGPSFAVGGGGLAGLEALAAAALLVEAGDADAVVVVAADEEGPVAEALAGGSMPAGAIAALVSASPAGAVGRIGATRLVRGETATRAIATGHLALVPLTSSVVSGPLVSAAPPDARGEIAVEPV